MEIRTKYAGYIDRQQEEISRLRASEDTRLPVDIDYLGISGLSKEIQNKLNQAVRKPSDRLRGSPASRRLRFRCC